MNKVFIALMAVVVLAAAGLFVQSYMDDEDRVLIGVISHAKVADPAFDGVKAYLREEGYIEGHNIVYDYGNGATGSIEKLDAEAERLVAKSPDVMLALSTPATIAAQKAVAGKDIPVIFAPNSDPVGANVVDSLQKPGRNTTGVTFGRQETKRLEWLTRLAPNARRICFPYNLNDKSPNVAFARLQEVQKSLNIELVARTVTSKEELIEKGKALCDETDAIFMPTDALIASQSALFIEYSIEKKIALSIPHRDGVNKGALMSFGFDLFDLGKQAGRLVKQVLNGANAGNLPVETAEFRLSLNRETLKKLQLSVSDSILRQAIIIE